MQTDLGKLALGNRGSSNKDEMDKEDPTQGIPDWLQPFTGNLEDPETHVPAHSSENENSDSEGAAKVVTNRKHRIHTHFLWDWNCDICLRTKITRVLCRRRNEGSISRAVKFGDLITADHKILNEGSEPWNNHRYAVVVQDLATQWIQSYPCKNQNITGVSESFMIRPRSQKLFTPTVHRNLANLVKNDHGIIGLPHLIDQKQKELQNELYEE